MDHAVVGRHAKPTKSDQALWKYCAGQLLCVLDIVFLCVIKKLRVMKKILLAALILGACSTPEKRNSEEVKGTSVPAAQQIKSDLPNMFVFRTDGEKIETRSLTGKVVLILFQPECDHCQREAVEIEKNIAAFKDYTLYFISADTQPKIRKFGTDYKLDKHSNIFLGQTAVDSILSNFGAIDAPSVYIYNASGKLVEKFNGETDINRILAKL